MENEQLLESFYALYKNKSYKECSKILKALIKKGDNSAWVWSRLSSVYYEQRKYKLAFRYATIAKDINPDSALVLWDYAASQKALKDLKGAMNTYLKIIKYSNYEIGVYYTGLGEEWAKSIKNDSKFLLSELYYMDYDDQNAVLYFRMFEKGLKDGIKTEFPKERIDAHFEKIRKTFN